MYTQLYAALSIMHQNGEVDYEKPVTDIKPIKSPFSGGSGCLPCSRQAAELFTDTCVGYSILIRVLPLLNNQSHQQTIIRGKVRGGTEVEFGSMSS